MAETHKTSLTRLSRKVALQRLAIGWERLWAALHEPLLVAGLAVALVASGVLASLPFMVRAGVLAVLGMLSIVLGAYAAFGQWDFKRLVAYSSINHMGFVVLGIAVMAYAYGLPGRSAGLLRCGVDLPQVRVGEGLRAWGAKPDKGRPG